MWSLAQHAQPDLEPELLTELVQLLLQAGADPAARDQHGCTPLHYAAFNHNRSLADLLLSNPEARQALDIRNEQGRTALATTLWHYDPQLVKSEENVMGLLLDCGANPNTVFPCRPVCPVERGYTARSVTWQHCDPHPPDTPLLTPLIVAVAHCDIATATFLLSRGADLNTVDSLGRTPLMHAVKTNDTAVVELLLGQAGVRLDMVDRAGWGLLEHSIALDPALPHSPTWDNQILIARLLALLAGQDHSEASRVARQTGAERCCALLCASPAPRPPHCGATPGPGPAPHREDSRRQVELLERQADSEAVAAAECWDTPAGCTVQQGSLHQHCSVLLHKVDVGRGKWGIYNYYRLQVR